MADDIVTQLQWLREEAAEIIKSQADEIEKLRAERLELWHLINNIDRAIHSKEPINPWWNDRVVGQQSKQWPSLWLNIRRACTEYLKVDARG